MKFTLTAAAFLTAFALPRAEAVNQIFADFVVSDGPDTRYFSILFDHADSTPAPQAVANFIGLATGSRPWTDSVTGEVRTDPFFDGMAIHQVSPNGFVAFGSRNGTGDDNAGWIFPDDFRSQPQDPYSVYYDNSGIPNNNGSRLFITIPGQAALSGVYTRIGTIQNTPLTGQIGRFNVQQISLAGTDSNGKPNPAITIDSVTIFREGDAVGFDETAWFLPTVSASRYIIAHDGSTFRLRWADVPGSAGNYYGSMDLVNWVGPITSYDPPGSGTLGADLGPIISLTPRTFYRGSSAFYPEWPSTEITLEDAVIQLTYPNPSNPSQTIVHQLFFDATGTGGAWSRSLSTGDFLGSGTITNAAYSPVNPFGGTLTFDNGTTFPNSTFALSFDYEAPFRKTSSRFSGGEGNNNVPPDNINFDGFWTYTPAP